MQIKEIQTVELNILKTFIRICAKYHLNYFMVGGSLLGAVRHQGFIPWDDDIDVGMLRADYERFLQVAPAELKQAGYFMQTPYSDVNYAFAFSKILDCHYQVQERFNHNYAKNGIFIDVFPFDVIPESSFARSSQVVKMKYTTAQLLLKLKYRPFTLKPDDEMMLSAKKQLSVWQLKSQRDLVMQRYNVVHPSENAVCKNLSSQYSYDKELILYHDLRDVISVPFASTFVQIPRKYDEILTNLYGDYMTLPPVAERISKHLTTVDLNAVAINGKVKPVVEQKVVKPSSAND